MLLKPAKDSVELLIFVSDIRKSLDFYQGTLGLEKTQEVQTPFGTVHRLRYGTSVVKLMDPKQVPPAGPIGLEEQLGIRCLSFVIRDLSGVCTVLKEKGVQFTMPETQVLPDRRIAMVKDPAEMADVAVFMASDKASGMTGTTVNLTMGSMDD